MRVCGSVFTAVKPISIVTVTNQAATCIDINASASGQPPPRVCQVAISTSGTNESSSTEPAMIRNVRMGFDDIVATTLKTKTAPVTRMTVSIIGGAQWSGAKRAAGCKMPTATTRTQSTAATDARIVSGPAQRSRLRMMLYELWTSGAKTTGV